MVNLRLILAFLAATLLILFLLQRHGATLVNDRAPHGILSFELAGKATESQSIAASWKEEGKTAIALGNIRLDFLFIPFYSLFLYMACGSLATIHPSRPQRIGIGTAFGCLLAGLLDVFENICMLASLKGRGGSITASTTAVLATAKFSLLAIALIHIAFSSLRLIGSRKGFAQKTP